MKYKESGYVLQVGDVIQVFMGRLHMRFETVTRLTKTMAICESEFHSAVRYPIKYAIGFRPVGSGNSGNINHKVVDK